MGTTSKSFCYMKFGLLFFAAVGLIIILNAIRTLNCIFVKRPNAEISRKFDRRVANASQTKADVVVLLSQCRSGSTIFGEMFNRRAGVSFFYEPLHAFRERGFCVPAREEQSQRTVEALEHLARCKLDRLSKISQDALAVTRFKDRARCVRSNLCFLHGGKMRHLSKHAATLTSLKRACERSDFRAMKVNYLRRLQLLAPLLRSNDGMVVKVVHLVRDPRAVIASRLRTHKVGAASTIGPYDLLRLGDTVEKLRLVFAVKVVREEASRICTRVLANARFAEEQRLARASAYLLVRFEDFCLQPVRVAERIYRFIGRETSAPLIAWLRKHTSATPKTGDGAHSVRRDPRRVMTRWRSKELHLALVREIQQRCAPAMQQLGYLAFESERDLRNLSMPAFT